MPTGAVNVSDSIASATHCVLLFVVVSGRQLRILLQQSALGDASRLRSRRLDASNSRSPRNSSYPPPPSVVHPPPPPLHARQPVVETNSIALFILKRALIAFAPSSFIEWTRPGAEIRPNLINRDVLCLWRLVPPRFGRVWPTSLNSVHRLPAAKLPIVSVPRVGFESITRSAKPVTPARRGGADRLSRTGQIRRDTAESRGESDATIVSRTATSRIPLTCCRSLTPAGLRRPFIATITEYIIARHCGM